MVSQHLKVLHENRPVDVSKSSGGTAKTAVRMQVEMDVPQEYAFKVFTEQFDQIKRREYDLLVVRGH